MAKRFAVNVKALRALLDVGLLCIQRKRFEDAEQIFRAVKAHRTGLPHPGVFLGLSFFTRGDLAGAEQELKASVAAYPADQLGKALLAVVCRARGRSDWRRMLREVLEDGRDAAASRFARLELDLPEESAVGGGGRRGLSHENRVYG